ncbi:MAG: FAD-binding oxidoreductase [Thermoanaerobaculum sp.]|nr:FAD-binding oxidoreductase [Thermoanaerobaculum sp.]
MSGARRFAGWGFFGQEVRPSAEALALLRHHVGKGDPLPEASTDGFCLPRSRAFGRLGVCWERDSAARLAHCAGQSFPDLVGLRTKTQKAFPDGVAHPATPEQVWQVLSLAARNGWVVVPRGGGTSVVGGVTVPQGERPTLVLLTDRLRGLVSLDGRSGLATFWAGTLGPEVEAELAAHGFWLGHEPQSFELSTVGGWVATRSAGHRSTGVGRIEDLLAGAEVALPEGLFRLEPVPAAAVGPELRQLLCGSEGRLGVFTRVTLRVRQPPRSDPGLLMVVPSWWDGMELCRRLLQEGLAPQVVRLSDAPETTLALALAELKGLGKVASQLLFARRRFAQGCLLLLGGGEEERLRRAWRVAGQLGAWSLGAWGWRRWLRDRFRHPYLRDAFLSLGFGVDTCETAAPWSALARLYEGVHRALTSRAQAMGVRVWTLCHLSHAYGDGASLYFTFFWALRRLREVEDWAQLKQAWVEAVLSLGGTLSHHHGVGRMHAPWLEREVGDQGAKLLRALARSVDPRGILNPGVLFPDGEP